MADIVQEQEINTKFGQEYQALCKKYNRVIKIEPYFAMTEGGSYVIKINRFIGKEDPNGR